MEFFLTSLEIFENYKNSNPQKCKDKSAIEICKLAGLDDRQIADLQASSAWLFYFDKENTSTPPNLNMTEIFGGEFSNDTDRNSESTKDVNTIVNNLMNICNDKNFLTRDLHEIEEIINNDVNEKNVVEFLSDFNKKNAKSFFDVIADYKFTNDTTRMDILLNLVSKLENASNDRGQDLSIIISKLKEKIRYEFRSVGLISKRPKRNINALFNAVITNLQRNKLNEPSKMANEFNEEFEIKAGIKYKFKENIQKLNKNKIYGKTCTYKLADGTQLIESYIYDSKSNKFYLEEKSWLDKENNIIKIAGYYSNEPQTIRSMHYYENGMQVESNHFRPDEIPSYKFAVNGDNYKAITYSKDGKPVEIRTIENRSDDEKRKDTTVRYNTKGFELVDVNPKDSTQLSIEGYYSIDKEQLRDLFMSKHSLSTIPYMTNWSLFSDSWGADIVCDIMETLAQKAFELGMDRNIDISDLNTKLSAMLQKKDVQRAAAILKQMLARVTKAYSTTDYKNYKNDLSFNSLYNEFSQGHFGTCWLTSAVKAMLLTEDGKKFLESAVKYNKSTGEVTVTLKGTPKGIRTYVYSKEEITQASELSTGNGMERAIEMAFRDMFLEFSRTKIHHSHDIEGNSTAAAFKIITGKEPDTYCAHLGTASYKIDEALEKIKNMKEFSCVCGFLGNFWSFVTADDNVTDETTRIRTGHAYVLQQVDDNFAYLINPWDTSKTIKIKLKDFRYYCESISIAQF